ncbi:IS91 family transposase [Neolewinella aurantiaca]|uniref:IS91 family transposase n=1 Tax=Neolewinella aurantiaca TaxID=2602767 RepID=A0A5C7FFM2_9BACT|nr:IS91 family transposase [Neolewinella aurantiaca]TXF84720.1 IS91 family transposase [Neolewinella aurantiaca]
MRNPKKRPLFEVADIIKIYGDKYRATGKAPAHHLRTLSAIERCRTAELGGHITVCTDCGASKTSYNSCRNRHCPKCGGFERELWIEDRKRELLPVRYQHIVFTIPHEFNNFCRYNANFCYSLLFRSAWNTLDTFARDNKWLGARAGASMVLHTWGQNLSLHPHVHAIIPSGGLDADGNWVSPKKGLKKSGFLFPVKAMSKVFRTIFLRAFMTAWLSGKLNPPPCAPSKKKDIDRWRRARYQQDWIVYAKAPFGGPYQVVEYLGRYTHKTAISNHRLLHVGPDKVSFHYKDYREKGVRKTMALDGIEFLRRFCLHILPPGWVRFAAAFGG